MRFSIMVFLCLCLSPIGVAWAQTENPYAILIVGNGGHAEMQRQEQVLIQQMAKTLRQREPGKKLPIFSYHFEKQRERAYCEKNLNVLAEDSAFCGHRPAREPGAAKGGLPDRPYQQSRSGR